MKFWRVNCQVGQHSTLLSPGGVWWGGASYAGRGVKATRPNWLWKICGRLYLKCPPSLQPHNLLSVWTESPIKTNGAVKHARAHPFNKLIMLELNVFVIFFFLAGVKLKAWWRNKTLALPSRVQVSFIN